MSKVLCIKNKPIPLCEIDYMDHITLLGLVKKPNSQEYHSL